MSRHPVGYEVLVCSKALLGAILPECFDTEHAGRANKKGVFDFVRLGVAGIVDFSKRL